jgi:cobalt-zinc-cadmium efflux system membrane fusion protein
MRPHHALAIITVASALVVASCGDRTRSPIATATQATAIADWCAGHGLPESKCTVCNPHLIEKFKAAGDWCAEHGYPESACPTCNPQKPPAGVGIAGAAGSAPAAADWCHGHGLPESKCTKCNPHLVEKFKAAGDWCAEHGYPESACPVCNPQPPPGELPKQGALWPGPRIRIRSAEAARAAGIETVRAPGSGMLLELRCPARLERAPDASVTLTAPVAGLIGGTLPAPGERVAKGATVALLIGPAIAEHRGRLGSARARLVAAEAQLRREEELLAIKVTSASEVEAARRERDAARAEVDATASALGSLGAGGEGGASLRSPIGGVLVERHVATGQRVEAGQTLFVIADPTRLVAVLAVREADAPFVGVGQPVELEVDGVLDRVVEGVISAVAPTVDPHLRTVEARADVANPDGILRAHALAQAVVLLSDDDSGVVVPREAVQRGETGPVVFVEVEPLLYEPRAVELGSTDGRRVQVLSGVDADERVVTTGAFLLKTELSKDAIGAGCCEVEQPKGT